SNYSFCPSYPSTLVIPARFPESDLLAVRDFRMKGRIPVCIWLHPLNSSALLRCSQPRVGLRSARGFADEKLLEEIRRANPSRNDLLVLVDARAKSNAVANQAIVG